MVRFIATALVFCVGSSAISDTFVWGKYEGQLVLNAPLSIQLKSKSISLKPGKYIGSFNTGASAGFLNSRRALEFSIVTDRGPINGKIKFNKRNNQLEDQAFLLRDESTTQRRETSAELAEERSCVVYSFTTQENCRTVTTYVCPGWESTEIIGKSCSVDYVPRTEVVCDSVTHNIPGRQMVRFKKVDETSTRRLALVDARTSSQIGSLVAKPVVRASEEIIAQDRCR